MFCGVPIGYCLPSCSYAACLFASQLSVVAHFLSIGNSHSDRGSGVHRGTAARALGVKVMMPICGFLDVVGSIQR